MSDCTCQDELNWCNACVAAIRAKYPVRRVVMFNRIKPMPPLFFEVPSGKGYEHAEWRALNAE